MQPKIIDRVISNDIYDTASFKYYDGIKYCRDHNIPQITSIVNGLGPWEQMISGVHKGYIVSCGWVIVRIDTLHFPTIERSTEVLV